VDEILVFNRKAGIAGFARLARQLARRPFDIVVDLQCYFKATIITALCSAPVKLGFDRARAREFNWLATNCRLTPRPLAHVQDHFLEFLDALSVPREPMEWNLGPWPGERAWQKEFFRGVPRPRLTLIAATTSPRRDWFADRWVKLADALHDEFALTTILAGASSPKELALGMQMAAECRHPPREALGCGLRRLVSILDGSDLVISLDTGPLHLARALGKPVIGLYGYNSPARVGPYRGDPGLLVDAYHDPGERPKITFAHRPGRMERIGVEDVLRRVRHWQQQPR
jgi:heptosyltransferase I